MILSGKGGSDDISDSNSLTMPSNVIAVKMRPVTMHSCPFAFSSKFLAANDE